MAGNLRSVSAGESPKPKRKPPATLKDAADQTERDLLVTMRSRLASTIDAGVPPHALAPLMRQLREVDQEIRMLDEKRAQEEAEDAAAGERRAWDPEAI